MIDSKPSYQCMEKMKNPFGIRTVSKFYLRSQIWWFREFVDPHTILIFFIISEC